MNKTLLALALAAVPFTGFGGTPVLAADTMGTPDCSKAPAMMQNAMAMAPSPAAGAMSVDAAYLKSMKAMLDEQSTMMKMEVACGTNATVKANAKKDLPVVQSHVDEVTRLLRSIGV